MEPRNPINLRCINGHDFKVMDRASLWVHCPECSGITAFTRGEARYNKHWELRNRPTPEANMDAVGAPASVHPDGNPKSAQGAKKYSLRHLPLPAAIEVNRALEDGRNKYGAANWRQTGVAATVYVDAALRHLAQWYDGKQECAADSGVHNLAMPWPALPSSLMHRPTGNCSTTGHSPASTLMPFSRDQRFNHVLS